MARLSQSLRCIRRLPRSLESEHFDVDYHGQRKHWKLHPQCPNSNVYWGYSDSPGAWDSIYEKYVLLVSAKHMNSKLAEIRDRFDAVESRLEPLEAATKANVSIVNSALASWATAEGAVAEFLTEPDLEAVKADLAEHADSYLLDTDILHMTLVEAQMKMEKCEAAVERKMEKCEAAVEQLKHDSDVIFQERAKWLGRSFNSSNFRRYYGRKRAVVAGQVW